MRLDGININGKEVLFQKRDNHILCTSLDISNVFEKEHKHVLRSIDNILGQLEDESWSKTNFGLCEHKGNTEVVNGRSYRYYNLTRDAFSLLAMGFNGRKALRWKVCFINAFNAIEDNLRKAEQTCLSDNVDREVFNLKYKTPCRNVVLEEARNKERQGKAKCKSIQEYQVIETFKNGIVKTNIEIVVEYDQSVHDSVPRIRRR